MSLIDKHMDLFTFEDMDPSVAIREFLKLDDMHGNMFMNVVYDYNDYCLFR